MKIKIALIVAAFIALCILSVRLSSPYFSSGMSTQTAHVLTSLRALHEWGFFTAKGTSILIPHSKELLDLDIHQFTVDFNEAIYLSYPSGWLDLPYAAYVLVHAVWPSIEVGPVFLSIYNIVVDRLLTAVLFAIFLSLFLGQLAGRRLSAMHVMLLSLIGCAFWLLSPPVLYWTQNAYGMDEAVIPFVLALLLFVAAKRCRISTCTRGEKIVLGILVFLLCWIDWYGWLTGAMTMGLCLLSELTPRRSSKRRLVAAYSVPVYAVICAGGLFLYQLMSFSDGFHQLIVKYGIRSAHSLDTIGMTAKLWRLWHDYLPFHHAVLFLVVAGLSYLWLLYKSEQARSVSTLTLALFLPPFVWTFLLPQHSAVHEFSLLKFALPTASLYVIVAAAIVIFCHRFLRMFKPFLSGLIFLFVCWFSMTMIMHHSYRPLVEQDDNWTRPFAQLMQTAVGHDDVPLSDADLLLGSRPPHKIWYANRWMYPPYALRDQIRKGLASKEALERMHPVYLRPEGSPVSAEADFLCTGLWKDSGVKILGSSILVCRNDDLRRLYMLN